MKDFIEVPIVGTPFNSIIALSAIAFIEPINSMSTRIVYHAKIAESGLNSYVNVNLNIAFVKAKILEAQKQQ